MRAISLTKRIKYFQTVDPQGDFGVLVLLSRGDETETKVAEISTEADFRYWYDQFHTQEVAGM